MEILIVDDEVTVVSLIKKHVDWESLGITNVWTAYNAQIAKKKVQEHPIDLIICDIEMPQENGLVFLGWVKEQYPEISAIILTAYPEFHYAQMAISLGVRRYLLKPISFAELSDTVRGMVNEIAEQKRVAVYQGKPEEKTETADIPSDGIRSVENSETIVGAVKAYVALHFEEPIGRQEIEEALHLNGDYLNRTFKAATGYSLIQYIQFYRIVTAKQLMREPHVAIAEIGSRVGMDASYFGKIFKKWTGQTPYEYYAHIHGKKEV